MTVEYDNMPSQPSSLLLKQPGIANEPCLESKVAEFGIYARYVLIGREKNLVISSFGNFCESAGWEKIK